MKILFLGNNWVGWQIVQWLREQQEDIVGLVVHPPHKRKYGEELVAASQVSADYIFDGSTLQQPDVFEAIRALKPDLGLSILFGYILKPDFINLFPQGIINLHPAYLPHNRGQYPNVWSIVEQTPAGVTLHYINPGIDTGDIIAQQQAPIEPIDTGQTLYQKLEIAGVSLFRQTWPQIRRGETPRLSQSNKPGTYHRTQDVETIDHIELDQTYTARELINIIRARTFPPYKGAYFIHEGRKIFMRLELLYEDQF